MTAKLTKEQFIEKAKAVHGNKYDYSKVDYVNNRTPIIIIDPILGEFKQTPSNHLKGQGHPSNKGKKISSLKRQQFDSSNIIERFHQAHPEGGYDYSKVVYKTMDTPVTIICLHLDSNGVEYGEYQQTPRVHLKGCGHPRESLDHQKKYHLCNTSLIHFNMTAKLTKEQFIEKAKAVHGNQYDYSKVDYVNNSTPVIIICPAHGEFQQKPNKHVDSKQGCPLCGKKQSTVFPAYEERFPVIEGEKYVVVDPKSDFSTDDYRNKSGVISTYLKKTYNIESGMSSFKERNYFKLYNHYWWEDYLEIRLVDDIKKETIKCPYCDWSTTDLENKSGIMIAHFKKVHNKTLEEVLLEHPEMKDYFHNTKVVDMRTEDEYVVCQICGKKLSRLNKWHLKSHGLSKLDYIKKYRQPTLSQTYAEKCRIIGIKTNLSPYFQTSDKFTSKPESEIMEFIRSKGLKPSKNRSILNGKELDIYIPSHNLAIEYNGCKWHTEWFGKKDKHYHYDKMIECNRKGVRLIHIFEDEYMYHKDIVLSKIEHILGIHTDLPKIGARQCTIININKTISDKFLDNNHIQSKVSASVYYGAYHNNELVAVMTFVKRGDDEYELNRFATDNKIVISGIASRLLKHFIKEFNPKKIISFADRRWTTDLNTNLYIKLGFTLDSCTKPDYRYYNEKVDAYKRFHKFGFRKQQLHNKYGFDMSMTEEEMVRELGYDRIWDCGLAKYVYINSSFN